MRTQKQTTYSSLKIGIFLLGMLLVSACSSRQTPTSAQEEAAAASATISITPQVTLAEETAENLPTAEATEPPVVLAEEGMEVDEPQNESYPSPGYPPPSPVADSGADPYPGPELAEAPPPLKTSLEATNPSSVVLDTGTPQLIEFFAFW